jgi:hypothetical protein
MIKSGVYIRSEVSDVLAKSLKQQGFKFAPVKDFVCMQTKSAIA